MGLFDLLCDLLRLGDNLLACRIGDWLKETDEATELVLSSAKGSIPNLLLNPLSKLLEEGEGGELLLLAKPVKSLLGCRLGTFS
jgi:hypothetical protein